MSKVDERLVEAATAAFLSHKEHRCCYDYPDPRCLIRHALAAVLCSFCGAVCVQGEEGPCECPDGCEFLDEGDV